ncbi:MAG TPA: hypothetical protein VIQ31_03740 [Phormidium sp.]
MQSIIELDLPESLAYEVNESVRPEYLSCGEGFSPAENSFFGIAPDF